MAIGPGKYDDVLTAAREQCEAIGAILIVLDGKLGSGFAVQAPPNYQFRLPRVLRTMADMIEADLKRYKQ